MPSYEPANQLLSLPQSRSPPLYRNPNLRILSCWGLWAFSDNGQITTKVRVLSEVTSRLAVVDRGLTIFKFYVFVGFEFYNSCFCISIQIQSAFYALLFFYKEKRAFLPPLPDYAVAFLIIMWAFSIWNFSPNSVMYSSRKPSTSLAWMLRRGDIAQGFVFNIFHVDYKAVICSNTVPGCGTVRLTECHAGTHIRSGSTRRLSLPAIPAISLCPIRS